MRRVGERLSRGRRVGIALPFRRDGGAVERIEPLCHAPANPKVPVRRCTHRRETGGVQPLGEERVAREVRIEVAAVAQRLARILADQHRSKRLARVRRHRVGAVEDDAVGGQRVELRCRRLIVTEKAHLRRAQRVDGDEDEVIVAVDRSGGDGRRGRGRGLGQREVGARAVFVDPVAGDVGRQRRDGRIAVVAVASSEEGGGAVVIPIGRRAQEPEGDASERGLPLDRDSDAGLALERARFTRREQQKGHHGAEGEPDGQRPRGAPPERERREPRAGRDPGHVEQRPQVELVSLEYAEDRQWAAPVAAWVAGHHADGDYRCREEKAHARGRDGVDGTRPSRCHRSEPAANRRKYGKPGSPERREPCNRRHCERAPRGRRRSLCQGSTGNLRGHDEPRGPHQTPEECHGGRP